MIHTAFLWELANVVAANSQILRLTDPSDRIVPDVVGAAGRFRATVRDGLSGAIFGLKIAHLSVPKTLLH